MTWIHKSRKEKRKTTIARWQKKIYLFPGAVVFQFVKDNKIQPLPHHKSYAYGQTSREAEMAVIAA